MKAQAVNIDWTIGFSLFLFTVLSSLLFISDTGLIETDNSDLESKAEDFRDSVTSNMSVETVRADLVLRQPFVFNDTPYYRDYFYRSIDRPEGSASEPSNFNFSTSNFATVTDTGNSTVNLSYASANFSSTYSSDLSSSTSWLNNSEVSLEIGGPGLESMKVEGKETIREAEIDFSSNFRETGVFHTSGNLTLFNSSKEFIVEDESFRVDARNFTDLYWEKDGNQYSLNSGTTIKQGETKGITVANSSLGITFLGNMTANVSRPDSSTVRIKIDSARTRIRLHREGLDYGKRRIQSFVRGKVFFDLERVIDPLTDQEVERVSNMTRSEFESAFSLQNYGYNFSLVEENSSGEFRRIGRGEEIPLKETSVKTFSENLIREGDLKKLRGRVVVWQ